jgi:hypothetical protein
MPGSKAADDLKPDFIGTLLIYGAHVGASM